MIKLFALAVALALLFGCAGSPIKEGVTPEGRPYRGADSPKLVIYEYSDFECPFCAKVQPTVEEVLRAYPDSVQLQYRYFPLSIHPRGYPSAVAAECAAMQGKFWPMHDLLFANQGALSDDDFAKYAVQIGLDSQKFKQCYLGQATGNIVRKDMDAGAALGIEGTPTFAVGGSFVRGSQPFSKFKQAIDAELAAAG